MKVLIWDMIMIVIKFMKTKKNSRNNSRNEEEIKDFINGVQCKLVNINEVWNILY